MSQQPEKSDKDVKLRQMAYMDEELSVDEVIALEESMSREEKACLESDMRLEAAIGDRLSKSGGCPDALWGRLKSQLEAQSTAKLKAAERTKLQEQANAARPPAWKKLVLPLSYVATAAAAALVAMLLIGDPRPTDGAVPVSTTASAGPVVVMSEDLKAFSMDATVPGQYEKVARALVINGFNLNFKRPGEDGHPVQLLGMRVMELDGHKAAQLYFSCCGKPVSVIVTERSDAEWLESFKYRGMSTSWTVRHHLVDGYQIDGVSGHDPQPVLDLFS